MRAARHHEPNSERPRFGRAAGERSQIRQLACGDEGPSNVRLLRANKRINVTIRALLHLRERFQTTTIRDISIGGACLEGAFAVVPGDRVVVQLNSGRSLKAEVKWWAYGRCGVAFEAQLPPDDLLLREGATGRPPALT